MLRNTPVPVYDLNQAIAIYPTVGGELAIWWDGPMSEAEYKDVEEWFELVLRRIKRTVVKKREPDTMRERIDNGDVEVQS